MKRFLGLTGYFRDYIDNVAGNTVHLRNLLHKGTPFKWTPDHETEFNYLKSAVTSPNVILQHPDWDKPFEIHTDASKHGVGAMLAQQVKGELKPVRFASRAFSETESPMAYDAV